MTPNIYREKMINAILFFAKETRFLYMTKLFKLLNFFDFIHFKETGYPAIGLEYETFQRGPVPRKLWELVRDGETPEYFRGKIALVKRGDDFNPSYKEVEFKAKPNVKPDLSVFSPREKKILETLAEIYRDARADAMSEVSHLPGQPWAKTKNTQGLYARIDYLLALDDKARVTRDEAEESLREHFEILKAFDIEPVK